MHVNLGRWRGRRRADDSHRIANHVVVGVVGQHNFGRARIDGEHAEALPHHALSQGVRHGELLIHQHRAFGGRAIVNREWGVRGSIGVRQPTREDFVVAGGQIIDGPSGGGVAGPLGGVVIVGLESVDIAGGGPVSALSVAGVAIVDDHFGGLNVIAGSGSLDREVVGVLVGVVVGDRDHRRAEAVGAGVKGDLERQIAARRHRAGRLRHDGEVGGIRAADLDDRRSTQIQSGVARVANREALDDRAAAGERRAEIGAIGGAGRRVAIDDRHPAALHVNLGRWRGRRRARGQVAAGRVTPGVRRHNAIGVGRAGRETSVLITDHIRAERGHLSPRHAAVGRTTHIVARFSRDVAPGEIDLRIGNDRGGQTAWRRR